MEIKKLTDHKHWEDSYVDVNFIKPQETSDIYSWLKEYVPKAKDNESSFEVGIYPATYSTIFGDLGYEINGIDRIKEINGTMRDWLLSENYKVGDLICDDFFTFKSDKKYSVVSSFGFIEHFENFEEVIKIQLDLVAENGYIAISVPNFRGVIQYLIKKLLDRKNLDIHYVPSMNFKKWENVLQENNFEIVSKEYLGSFSLDFYEQERNFFQKKMMQFLKRYRYFIKKNIFKGVSKHYSPLMIMLAKKK